MVHVKICGVRRIDDALAAAEAGADYVGLNFYEPSPRSVSLETAQEIARALPSACRPVGLFVNAPLEFVRRAIEACQLSHVQCHGDEPREYLRELHRRHAEVSLIRVLRGLSDGSGLTREAAQCEQMGLPLAYLLVDASAPGRYGGTGQTLDWHHLASRERPDKPPLMLAGGLTPDNVAQAVRLVRPDAVDVAGGVESSPGVKDPAKIQAFLDAVRAADGSSPLESQ